MCKHVAAVLYGIGARLDHSPEVLFVLRQVDHNDLIVAAGQDVALGTKGPADGKRLDDAGLALHAGRLPGYPSADRAVRLPADIAPLIFQRVKQDTPVKIEE